MKDLVLEIGCEDLPPSFVRPAVERLAEEAGKLLAELRLAHGELYSAGTPRRLVLLVADLEERQSEAVETITGPPLAKAFDGQGKPTKAALGFAKSKGVPPSKLTTVEKEKGYYVGFERKLPRRKAAVLLRERLPSLIAGIRFPKSMRWDGEGARFARPIRWLVCLYGSEVIRFEFAGVTSGRSSYTIPWLDPRPIRIASASTYTVTLEKRGVILDQEKRKQALMKLADRAASRERLTPVEDPGLLEELTYMLEGPRILVGTFEEKYLELPEEVVVTAMKAHQRYLALRRKSSTLAPRFLAFYEGRKKSPARIRRGNEKVLRARLEDALFYWKADLKRGVDELASKLSGIVFIEGLGTMHDKGRRLYGLISFLEKERGGREFEDSTLERMAVLAKADLASDMVRDGKEFTLLEGLMGSHYARLGGEEQVVVDAIREHCLPRNPSDPLPETEGGILLAVADRIDTICGCFLVGLAPSGSQDPYGLRRLMSGLIRILHAKPLVRLDRLVDKAIELYRSQGVEAARRGEPAAAIADFIRARLEFFIREKGVEYDVARAVIPVSWQEPAVCVGRAESLAAMRHSSEFQLLVTGAKRVGNILPAEKKLVGMDWTYLEKALRGSHRLSPTISFDPALFEDESEKALLAQVLRLLPKLKKLDSRGAFEQALEELSRLGPAIDTYFERVLVNADDPAIRENRHNFLAVMFALFFRYADFSHIVENGAIPPP